MMNQSLFEIPISFMLLSNVIIVVVVVWTCLFFNRITTIIKTNYSCPWCEWALINPLKVIFQN